MKIIKIALSIACISAATQSGAVEDSSPHVVIQISKQKNSHRKCDHHRCNTRIFLCNMAGIALGTLGYAASSTLTHNLASQIIATVSLGTLPPLLGAACEIYSCYKNR